MGLRLSSAPPALPATQAGVGITTIELSDEPTGPIGPGTSVNLKVGGGSFHAPLAAESGTWWFTCTDNSIVWNATDEALINGIGGAAVPGAIANGSRIVAIGDSDQQFRLNGTLAAGPLIYRSVGLVTIQRPEGSDIYEVSVESGGGASVGGEFTIPLQATAPDPATNQLWLDNTGGGLVLNASDRSSWFEV